MKAAALSLVCLLFAGCLSFARHPAGISPAAFETQGRSYDVLDDAEGYSSSFTLFWLFPFGQPSLDDAVAEAVRSKGGDNLINVSIYKERDIYITGTVDAVRVTGKVIKYTKTK